MQAGYRLLAAADDEFYFVLVKTLVATGGNSILTFMSDSYCIVAQYIRES